MDVQEAFWFGFSILVVPGVAVLLTAAVLIKLRR